MPPKKSSAAPQPPALTTHARFASSPYLVPVSQQQHQHHVDIAKMSAAQVRELRVRREVKFANDLTNENMKRIAGAELEQQSAAAVAVVAAAAAVSEAESVPTPLHQLFQLAVFPLFADCVDDENADDDGVAGEGQQRNGMLGDDDIALLHWTLTHAPSRTATHSRSEEGACDRLFSVIVKLLLFCVNLDCAVEEKQDAEARHGQHHPQQQQSQDDSKESSASEREDAEEEDEEKDDDGISAVAEEEGVQASKSPPSIPRSTAGVRGRLLVKQFGLAGAVQRLLQGNDSVRAVSEIHLPLYCPSSRALRDSISASHRIDPVSFVLQCAAEMSYPRMPSLSSALFRCASHSFTSADAVAFRGVVGEFVLFTCWICERYDAPLLAAACTILRAQRLVTDGEEEEEDAAAGADYSGVSAPLASAFLCLAEQDASLWLLSSEQQQLVPPASSFFNDAALNAMQTGLPVHLSNSRNGSVDLHSHSAAAPTHLVLSAVRNLRLALERHSRLRSQFTVPFTATDLVLCINQNAAQRELHLAAKRYLQLVSALPAQLADAAAVIRDVAEVAAVASIAAFPQFVLATKRGVPAPPTARIAMAINQCAVDGGAAATSGEGDECRDGDEPLLRNYGERACARLSSSAASAFAVLEQRWNVAAQLGHDRHLAATGEHIRTADAVADMLGSSYSLAEFVRGAMAHFATPAAPLKQYHHHHLVKDAVLRELCAAAKAALGQSQSLPSSSAAGKQQQQHDNSKRRSSSNATTKEISSSICISGTWAQPQQQLVVELESSLAKLIEVQNERWADAADERAKRMRFLTLEHDEEENQRTADFLPMSRSHRREMRIKE